MRRNSLFRSLLLDMNGLVQDIDGNSYSVVRVGPQEWLAENLKVTKYSDGSLIRYESGEDFQDWYLPSYEELNAMYTNLHLEGVGNFNDGGGSASHWYWCSTEIDADDTWAKSFYSGNWSIAQKHAFSSWVRPIRSFTSSIGDYNLRDRGPAGGFIFYIDGTTYYEAAEEDLSAKSIWSNVYTSLSGASGTAIGTGQANTSAITAQVGHTTSAAKECEDFSRNIEGWFMPSKDEVGLIYTNIVLGIVGNVWGATRVDSSSAAPIDPNPGTIIWNQSFATGVQSQNGLSSDSGVTIACRIFKASRESFSIGDVGPAGGFIFYIVNSEDGKREYYEARSSLSLRSPYCNVMIPTTGTGVGDGVQNTIDIIATSGHIASLAQDCQNLSLYPLWGDSIEGKYCFYDNAIANKGIYGALYNWYAATNAKSLAYIERDGVQESGWRVPTKEDFETLRDAIGDADSSGGKLKQVGTTLWNSPNTGATDEVEFEAKPAGNRSLSSFNEKNQSAYIWNTYVPGGGNYGNFLFLYYNSAYFSLSDVAEEAALKYGCSVRLVRDV